MSKPTQNTWTHWVTDIDGAVRITDYCGLRIPILGSRTAAKRAVATGRIWLNGEEAQLMDSVREGDLIEGEKPAVRQRKAPPSNIDLGIVYEDDYLIVVNKPGGIAVNGDRIKTVENVLSRKARKSREEDAFPGGPVAAHRIDVPTKGLVLLAKTKRCLIGLNKAFQNNEVGKGYVAIVHGKVAEHGRMDSPIQGKRAITGFERMQIVPSRVFKHLSMVELKPITGRTHQLRIHLLKEGHLIVGDKQYAEGQKTILGKGLFLCACLLKFTHPITKEDLRFSIDPPARFTRLLKREEERFKK